MRKRLKLSLSYLSLAACLLAACTPGPERPTLPAPDADAGFSTVFAEGSGTLSDQKDWWRLAVGDHISAVLEQALASNPELREATAVIDAARAELAQAESDRGPKLDLEADARAIKESGSTRNTRSIGVAGSVPLDVSGALAYRADAARANLRVAVADAEQLQSDLARDFLSALIDRSEASQRLALLDRQIEVSRTLLRLTELRFSQGLASSVDVLQQRDELAALRQQIPSAQLDRITADNRLRRIGARTPDKPPLLAITQLPDVSSGFRTIKPIDLLERRAALRASRAEIEAADARFAAALADRLPSLSLSGDLVTRALAGDVTTLINAAIDASLTLFDGGGKVAIAEQRRSELAAAGERYLTDWLAAVIEVDDLINTEARLRERIVLSEQRLDTVDTLLRAATRRYERGVSDYLPVLAALRGQQQQQRDHLALQAELARARVQLHRALG